MLPLWSLLAYAKSHPVDRFWRDSPWKLLETFFRLGAGSEQLEALAVNLLWDGPPAWKFAPGSEGGVEVRWKGRIGADDGFNIIEQMGKVEQRLATYQEILVSSSVEDQDVGELFVRLSRRWLVPGSSAAGVPKLEVTAEEDPLQSLIIAKLVMGMLEKFKDKLAADPDNMIELVKQLLDEWSESDNAKKKRAEDLRKANYAGLRNIVQQRQSKAQQDDGAPAGVDSSDVLPVALSLLNTLLSAPNFQPTTQTSSTLSTIIPTLSSLSNPEPGSDLPPSVSMTAFNLTTRVSTLLNLPLPSSSTKTPSSNAPSTSNAEDEKTLQTALTDLTSPHPPIRASALSAITTLATAHSPALDLPQLTLLLLHTALPDADEYVHLHAINALTALSALDPHLVAGNLLVTAFLDASETAALDTRLRIGEALGRVVADLRAGP
ncbi:Armadillo-like helical, partial [Neofusicoccum parvum]